MKKRAMFMYMVLFVLWFALYAAIETLKTKGELTQAGQTSLLDQEGNPILPAATNWIHHYEIPELFLDYIDKEGITNSLPNLLYSNQPIKRFVTQQLMEHSFSKQLQQEIVVNKMYFNNGIVGMGNASSYYFNKKLSETTELEQTLLLMLSQKREYKNIKTEMHSFLLGLENKGYITKVEQQKMQSRIPSLIDRINNPNTIAQSYTQQVVKELKETFDLSEGEIFRKGYAVRTTLDSDIQERMYQTFQDMKNFPYKERSFIEAGGAVIEEDSGRIAALMGGRYYHTSTFNRATDTTRQPASTFKPLIEYAPAIDMGWKPTDYLKDVPMKVGDYEPKNYDGEYRKQVTLEEALVHSYNIPAVWLLNEIGLNKGLQYMDKFDLFSLDREDGFGLALGFTSIGTSPLSMAQAYTIFPNEGKMTEAHAVERIESQDGKRIYKTHRFQKRIIKEKTAETMLPMLQEVVKSGTGDEAQMKGQKIAGKTGTTSYDGWFVGFNDKYVGSFWIGPDEVTPRNRMVYSGAEYPAELFKKVFSEID